jgi:hypothetical protein
MGKQVPKDTNKIKQMRHLPQDVNGRVGDNVNNGGNSGNGGWW